MQRIRYKFDGQDHTAGPFFVGKDAIYVIINTEDRIVYFDDYSNSNYTAFEWSAGFDQAKRFVKHRLTELGVVFAKERRIAKK